MNDPNEQEKLEILREILQWQRLQGKGLFPKIAREALSDDKKKKAYEMTDGKTSQPEIAERVGVATGTVSNWWREWHSRGILVKIGSRYKKIASLRDFPLEGKDEQ